MNFSRSQREGEHTVRGFCSQRGIAPKQLLPSQRAALIAIVGGRGALTEELQRAQPQQELWGVYWRLQERACEHAMATIALWATEFPAQAEVVSRAAFEHSVTLLYLLEDPTYENFAAYVQDFLAREHKVLRQLTGLNQAGLRAALRQRESALRKREEFVNGMLATLGLEHQVKRVWPQLLQRCQVLGLEPEYRLFYSQLSAQGHADPEDILNELMAGAFGHQDLVERMAVETVEFSWTLTVAALDLYLKTIATFSRSIGSGSAAKLAELSRKSLPRSLLAQ